MTLAFLTGALSRACLLLAFSEFIFFNEGPGLALAQAGSALQFGAVLGELVLFYLLAGALLFVLEPLATSWSRALLVGAFIGWSIEAAMVPAAYENVPYSYLWTAVSWHAPVDVCLGVFLLRAALCWRLWRLALFLALLGAGWAVWTTWAWDAARLSVAEFGQLALGVVALLITGLALMRPAPVAPLGKAGAGLVIGVNVALWALWAASVPLAAAGLAALAGLTGWALWRGPAGAQQVALKRPVAPWRYGLIAALGMWAGVCYAWLDAADWHPESALMTGSVAITGALLWMNAVVRQAFASR